MSVVLCAVLALHGCDLEDFVGQPEDGRGQLLDLIVDSKGETGAVGTLASVLIFTRAGTDLHVFVTGGTLISQADGAPARSSCLSVPQARDGAAPTSSRVVLSGSTAGIAHLVVSLLRRAEPGGAEEGSAGAEDARAFEFAPCPFGVLLEQKQLSFPVPAVPMAAPDEPGDGGEGGSMAGQGGAHSTMQTVGGTGVAGNEESFSSAGATSGGTGGSGGTNGSAANGASEAAGGEPTASGGAGNGGTQ
jgi:hypothetical protein